MSFRLLLLPPPQAPARRTVPAVDPDDALYDLADAGARAVVELDGYRLELSGIGVAELAKGCRSLLAIIDGAAPLLADEELRGELPGAAPEAVIHQWLFSSWMYRIPVLIFAVTPARTWIATRTHEEGPGWPLVVLAGRDLAELVAVDTGEVKGELNAFLEACGAAARAPSAQ
jgi:hypothetical protein